VDIKFLKSPVIYIFNGRNHINHLKFDWLQIFKFHFFFFGYFEIHITFQSLQLLMWVRIFFIVDDVLVLFKKQKLTLSGSFSPWRIPTLIEKVNYYKMLHGVDCYLLDAYPISFMLNIYSCPPGALWKRQNKLYADIIYT